MRDPVQLNPVGAVSERARAYFQTETTYPREFRVERLRALEAALRANEDQVFAALKADLGKPRMEAYSGEIGNIYGELKHSLKHLKSWMKPVKLGLPMFVQPGRGYQFSEPLGTALIIAPWNYPLGLALSPLIGAICAGCNAVVKPSELAPATAEVIETVLTRAFGNDGYVTVVQGGPDQAKALLAEQWDLVFFTGSTRVGQSVMEAAAKHLTPCVLELGGKSPCIVDETTNLEVTARRIVWAKFYNAGQTCVAPDYLLAHKNVHRALLDQLAKTIGDFYGKDPAQCPDFGRIVNERHFDRLQALMSGGRVVVGGQSDRTSKYLAPTVLTDVNLAHPLMQEEIFGPILPVLEVADLGAAIRFVRERPKPLALYVFTSNSNNAQTVLNRTSAGGAVVNDAIIHVGASTLPFGGVGGSGTGAYHGKASFDAFSHRKSVLKKPWFLDLKMRYPPYDSDLRRVRRLIG